jgi:hypothetical protein
VLPTVTALFFSAPVGRGEASFVDLYATDPRICLYVLVYLGYLCYVMLRLDRAN